MVVQRTWSARGWCRGLGLATGLAAGGGALALSSPARAEEPTPTNEDPPVLTGRLGTGVYAGHTPTQDAAAVSPSVSLGIRVRPEVELGTSFGVATLHRATGGVVQRDAVPGNLGFGVRLVRERRPAAIGDRWRSLHVGFGFALPTGFADGGAERAALDYALANAGGWNPWEWEPATMAIVIPAGARFSVLRRLELGADVTLAGMFSASTSTGAPAAGAQAAGQARYVLPWFSAGVRLQGTYNGRQDDPTQAAVVPFADLSLCRATAERRLQGVMSGTNHDCPVQLVARLNVNLDGPYGFVGPDSLRVWGVQAGLAWAVF